jgi:hypothetical protein
VSLKIVFNGKQYDSVDAMPPDVRKEYDVALETLRKSGGEEILSVLQRGVDVAGTHIKATVRESGAAGRPSVAPAARAVRPPPISDDPAARGGGLWRVLFWIAVGAVGAWWLLRRG